MNFTSLYLQLKSCFGFVVWYKYLDSYFCSSLVTPPSRTLKYITRFSSGKTKIKIMHGHKMNTEKKRTSINWTCTLKVCVYLMEKSVNDDFSTHNCLNSAAELSIHLCKRGRGFKSHPSNSVFFKTDSLVIVLCCHCQNNSNEESSLTSYYVR